MLPSGESRLAYLYIKPGREARLRDVIDQNWPGKFELIPSKDALAAGLFGPGHAHPRLEERVGDYILLAHDNAYLWWSDRDNPLLGRHGGMTEIEMIVPLLGLVI